MEKVPDRIWLDNLTPVVKEIFKRGKRTITERFTRFCLHYGIEPVFCNPGKGNEKGNVEGKVKYIRRNFFVPMPRIESIEQYNKELLKRSDKDMERIHYRKRIKIKELFLQEKKEMKPCNLQTFDICKLKKAKTNKYGILKFETNRYPVSPKHIETQVWLKIKAHTIEILDEDHNPVVKHHRLYGKNLQSLNWNPYLETIMKKPRSLKYTGFYQELPSIWKEYFENCDYKEKKDSLKLLVKILREKDIDTAVYILKQNKEKENCNAEALYMSYRRLIQKEPSPLPQKENIPKLTPYTTNFEEYDSLVGDGK
jgi:hypothetical protein